MYHLNAGNFRIIIRKKVMGEHVTDWKPLGTSINWKIQGYEE